MDKFNQIKGYSNLFTIGDIAAHLSNEHPKGLPMLAQVAIQQGDHLASNLIRMSKKTEMKRFEYKDKETMATIGRNRAVVDLPKFKFQGWMAWFVWMFITLFQL